MPETILQFLDRIAGYANYKGGLDYENARKTIEQALLDSEILHSFVKMGLVVTKKEKLDELETKIICLAEGSAMVDMRNGTLQKALDDIEEILENVDVLESDAKTIDLINSVNFVLERSSND